MSFMSHGLINLAAPPLLMGIAASGDADMDAIVDLFGRGRGGGRPRLLASCRARGGGGGDGGDADVARAAVVVVTVGRAVAPCHCPGVITADESPHRPLAHPTTA